MVRTEPTLQRRKAWEWRGWEAIVKACGRVLAKRSQTRVDLTPGAIVCHPVGSTLRRVVKDKMDTKSGHE